MTTREAVSLIHEAVPRQEGIWADLGCGDGTFTRALVELVGRSSRIYAVDRDVGAVAALERDETVGANVIPVVADFTSPFELPGLDGRMLDGMLFANTLHFVEDAGAALTRLTTGLRPGGRVVFVEYDRRPASRWVPYPIPPARLKTLATSAGLSEPVITTTRSSAYGGRLYAAAADRLSPRGSAETVGHQGSSPEGP